MQGPGSEAESPAPAPFILVRGSFPSPPPWSGAASCPSPAYLGQVQLPTRAPCANDQVLGEEEALPLALLPQGQRPQAAPGDLALLTHGHLDEGSCGQRREAWLTPD